ncbi:NADH:flavorubredoxin reductase NorW [Shewanella sp. N2AIL]|jgi:nitric oxide reductase FlRd-NAD(+) reductase|uniref:NADH:flavorubredoxin reductase NorW n=1 Tax=Shewanella TaxID=22 RepID=UPI001CF20A87|nr:MULTISPECIES: NADH:flavorubredoxin reductase NorW [Shewanella]MCB2384041.1 NADH:flavorubredoxin reductase NorW [Shewanella sp. SR1]MCI2963724.1 NADH:flavorubredoxin reductase NorW [Shewanella sp. N2AIL]MCS6232548.1 NADH:flavorubredoxin reductase NorW [Shewanella baltica]
MPRPIVIIGSGFAAYQLVKTLRRLNTEQAITLITADSGDEYHKPDLSHVFSRQQMAADLIKLTAAEFAKEQQIDLLNHSEVTHIDKDRKVVFCTQGREVAYEKLVLATGARPFIPKMSGDAINAIHTFNSLSEYQACQANIRSAAKVLVIGAGLVGVELAMDLATAGKQVFLVDPQASLMANLLPEMLSQKLAAVLAKQGVTVQLQTRVSQLQHQDSSIAVSLDNDLHFTCDAVICAAGLIPNSQLAQNAGLEVNKGIIVNEYLQTSDSDIYALGDCAHINGQSMAYLQPALLSANALASTLLNQATAVNFPAMLVKVKTPLLPMQLGGITVSNVHRWRVDIDAQGTCIKALDADEILLGFIVTEDKMKQAFGLLKQLNSPNTVLAAA